MSLPRRTSVVAVSIVLSFAGLASAQAPPTVWHALGIPQGWGRFRDSTANRWGNHPNLERKPPLKGLADPANLQSDVPAIKAAAEIKAQQDLAPQKIKAIKYLGQIGCGCYGGVAEALMAALEDCTEVVRLAAAEALAEALSCKCDVCDATCCTPELAAKMYERAYGRDENGCYLEPSERVRAALEQAVAACPPTDGAEGSVLIPDTEDTRGIPTPPVVPNIEDRPPAAPPVPGSLNYRGNEVDPLAPSILQYDPLPGDASTSSRRGQPTPAVRGASLPQGRTPATGIGFHPPVPQIATTPVAVCGEVVDTRSAKGAIRVIFADNRRPPVGTELDVYHEYVLGTEFAGTLVIRDYEGNHAIAMAKSWENVKVSRGDQVECVMHIPVAEVQAPPPTQPQVPPVRTAQQEPTPAQPQVEQPEAEPAPAPAPVVASRTIKASPAASAVSKAAGVRPASIPRPHATKVVTKTAVPAAPVTKAVETPEEAVEEDRKPLLDSWNAGQTISRATSGVERIFTLSTEKAASLLPEAKPESQRANAPATIAPSALSKAAPATRTARPARVAGAKAVSTPAAAPVVKPSDVTRTTRPAPVTSEKSAVQKAAATTPVATPSKPTASNAFSQMLRLPTEQAAPQPRPATTQSATPRATSPLTRGSSVVPASANLPAPIVNGTERLPPIVSADEARRTR
jgi:hypothetical protein